MVKTKDSNLKPEAHRCRTKVLVGASIFIVAALVVGVILWRRFQPTGLPSVSIRYQGGSGEWISELPGQSPESLVITAYNSFKPPPYEQWLALGAGVEPRTRGPSLAGWAALKGEHEPQLLGRTLSAWLLRAAPTPTASDTVQSIAALREDAALAVNEMGTNVIPWLLQWAQESSSQNHLLSSRGFGMLNQRAALVVPALGELACSEMPALRARAYRCFTSIGPDWTTLWPALVPALHQQDPATRMQAAEYLCQNYPLECKGIGLDKFIQPYSPLYWYLLHYTNSAGAQELDR